MIEQVLTYSLPVLFLLLGLAALLAVRYKEADKRRQWALRKESQKTISPMRMQAYERLALLLERTTPEHMLLGVAVHELTPAQLQQHLLQTIRSEFDHNLSMQIYVSDEVWEKVMLAKNEMLTFVNAVALQLPKDSSTLDYARTLLEAYDNNGDTPNQLALEALKDEAKTLL